jgi:outer membrane protein
MLYREKLIQITMGMQLLLLSQTLLAESSVQLGFVASANSSFYKELSEEYYFLPLAIVDYDRFYLQGIDGGYRFFKHENLSLAVEIRRTFDGYRSNESDALIGMQDRDPAWEAGLVYEQDLLGGQAKGKLLHDISGTHKGYIARVEYERLFLTGSRYMVSWFGGSEYWSNKKTDYYFGVTEEEVRMNRPYHKANDCYNVFAGLNLVKQFNESISLIASAEYLWMGDEVKDSPVSERQDQWTTYAGIFYKF